MSCIHGQIRKGVETGRVHLPPLLHQPSPHPAPVVHVDVDRGTCPHADAVGTPVGTPVAQPVPDDHGADDTCWTLL